MLMFSCLPEAVHRLDAGGEGAGREDEEAREHGGRPGPGVPHVPGGLQQERPELLGRELAARPAEARAASSAVEREAGAERVASRSAAGVPEEEELVAGRPHSQQLLAEACE